MRVFVAAAVFMTAFCYLSLFATYGVDFADEGTLLHQFERVSEGERPFVDFRPAGTPGVYWVHSVLQGLFDQSLVPGRRVLALVNAGTAAAVAAMVYPLLGAVGALLAGFGFLSMLPVHAGEFAAFNIPYPAWYCAALLSLGMIFGRRFLESRSDGDALVVGVLAGVAFAFKPNAGALQLASSMLLVLSVIPFRAERAFDRFVAPVWWFGVWSSVLIGIFVVFGLRPAVTEAAAFVGPLVFCAILTVRSASREELPVSCAGLTRLTSTVVVGFLLVTVPWFWVYARELGGLEFIAALLEAAAGFGAFFPHAHPISPFVVVAIIVFYMAAFTAPNFFQEDANLRLKVVLAGFFGGITVLSAWAWFLPTPGGFLPAVMGPLEAFWAYNVAVAVVWLLSISAWIAMTIANRFGEEEEVRARDIFVLAVGAAFLYCQIYPRIDFVRWVSVSPLVIAGGIYLTWILADRWDDKQELSEVAGLVVRAVFFAPVILLIGLRVLSSLDAVADMNGIRPSWTPSTELRNERAPLWVNVGRAPTYSGLNDLVEFLQSNTEPGETVVTFPALDFVSFVSGRSGLASGGYHFPGWFDRSDEARSVFAILTSRPPYVVLRNDNDPHFARSAAYYFQLMRVIDSEYRPVRRFGRFLVFERADRVDPNIALQPGAPYEVTFDDALLGEGQLYALESPDASVRGAAVERISEYRVEGYSPVLTAMLSDPSASVRNAAVVAMSTAENGRSAEALREAVLSGRVGGHDGLLALRLAAAWSDAGSVPDWLRLVHEENALVSQTAQTALAGYAGRSFAGSFWPSESVGDAALETAVDEDSRAALRAALFDPDADVRLRAFAVRVAGLLGFYRDPCPPDLGETLIGRYLVGFARDAPDASVAAVAVDRLGSEELFASRTALETFAVLPESDRLLDSQISELRDPRSLQRLLWIAAETAGPMSTKAALRRAGSKEPAVRAAGLWVGGRRGNESAVARLERAAEEDPDENVREFAEMSVELVRGR